MLLLQAQWILRHWTRGTSKSLYVCKVGSCKEKKKAYIFFKWNFYENILSSEPTTIPFLQSLILNIKKCFQRIFFQMVMRKVFIFPGTNVAFQQETNSFSIIPTTKATWIYIWRRNFQLTVIRKKNTSIFEKWNFYENILSFQPTIPILANINLKHFKLSFQRFFFFKYQWQNWMLCLNGEASSFSYNIYH